jgi:hypothetical protein
VSDTQPVMPSALSGKPRKPLALKMMETGEPQFPRQSIEKTSQPNTVVKN